MSIPILKELATAVARFYKGDPSKPGVIVSLIEQGRDQVWYAAVHRFKEQFGGGKVVVASTEDRSDRGCLIKLARTWLAVEGLTQGNPTGTKLGRSIVLLTQAIGGQLKLISTAPADVPEDVWADNAEAEGRE